MSTKYVLPAKYEPLKKRFSPMQVGDMIPTEAVEQAWLKQVANYYPELFKAPEPMFGKKPFYGDIQPQLIGLDGLRVEVPQIDQTVAIYRYVLYNEDWIGAGQAAGKNAQTNTSWLRQKSVDGGTTWIDDGICLTPDGSPFGSIATGTAVYDKTNDIVHYYAVGYADANHCGTQSIAHWIAKGIEGVAVYQGTIIENPYTGQNPLPEDPANRDPRLTYMAEYGQWVMLVARIGGFEVFTNPDVTLQTNIWTDRQFLEIKDYGTVECGGIYKMVSTDDGSLHWVLIFGGNGYAQVKNPLAPDPMFTTAPYIKLYQFDGQIFTPEEIQPEIGVNQIDNGADAYPPAVTPLRDGTYLMTTSIMNWGYANQLPTQFFQGTIANDDLINLRQSGTGTYQVVSKMAGCGLKSLFEHNFVTPDQHFQGGIDEATGITNEKYLSVLGQTELSLPRSWRFDFNVKVTGTNISVAQFILSGGGQNGLVLDMTSMASGYVRITRQNFGLTPYNADGLAWYGSYEVPVTLKKDGSVDVTLIYSAGILKGYFTGGRRFTMQSFPCTGAIQGLLRAKGTDDTVTFSGMNIAMRGDPDRRGSGLTFFEANGLYLSVDFAKNAVTSYAHAAVPGQNPPDHDTVKLHQVTYDLSPCDNILGWPKATPNSSGNGDKTEDDVIPDYDPTTATDLPPITTVKGLGFNTKRNGPLTHIVDYDPIFDSLSFLNIKRKELEARVALLEGTASTLLYKLNQQTTDLEYAL